MSHSFAGIFNQHLFAARWIPSPAFLICLPSYGLVNDRIVKDFTLSLQQDNCCNGIAGNWGRMVDLCHFSISFPTHCSNSSVTQYRGEFCTSVLTLLSLKKACEMAVRDVFTSYILGKMKFSSTRYPEYKNLYETG